MDPVMFEEAGLLTINIQINFHSFQEKPAFVPSQQRFNIFIFRSITAFCLSKKLLILFKTSEML